MNVYYKADRYRHILWLVKMLRLYVQRLEGGDPPPDDWQEILEEVDFILLMERDIMDEEANP